MKLQQQTANCCNNTQSTIKLLFCTLVLGFLARCLLTSLAIWAVLSSATATKTFSPSLFLHTWKLHVYNAYHNLNTNSSKQPEHYRWLSCWSKLSRYPLKDSSESCWHEQLAIPRDAFPRRFRFTQQTYYNTGNQSLYLDRQVTGRHRHELAKHFSLSKYTREKVKL
jgi:hypothetical protein